jgi:hypothetical protein
MAGLKEADYIAWRIARAREHEAKRIAAAADVPLGEVRSWRHGTYDLEDSIVVEICHALGLDAEALEQHRQRCRQRPQAAA